MSQPAEVFEEPRAGAGAWRELGDFFAFARRRPSLLFGLVVVAVTIFLAIAGPHVAPYDPEHAPPGMGLQYVPATDPESHQAYGYFMQGATSFQLCGDFELASDEK